MHGFGTQIKVPFDTAVARITEAVLQLVKKPAVRTFGEEVRALLQRVARASRRKSVRKNGADEISD